MAGAIPGLSALAAASLDLEGGACVTVCCLAKIDMRRRSAKYWLLVAVLE